MRLGKIRIHGPVRLFKGLHCTTPLFDFRHGRCANMTFGLWMKLVGQ